jgi:hypothetical protein
LSQPSGAEGTIQEPSDTKELRIWHQNDAVAVGIIKGALSNVQLGHVMGVDHARDVWETLKKIHQSDDRARLKGLPAEFMRFRLDASIDEGASKLTRLQSEIGNIDADSRPSDPIKIEALLAGLGPEYEATLAAIDASGSAGFEETVSRLKRAGLRLKGSAGPESCPNDAGQEEERPML